jgi:hypothetical protein
MTDENANTADLTMNEKLDRILQRLAALESQGANSTRPLLDQIVKELVETREMLMERIGGVEKTLTDRLDRIEKRLEVVPLDLMETRADQRRLTERMDDLERRPN